MSTNEITTELSQQLERLIAEAVRGGASMAEIARLKDPSISTPQQALDALKRGNERFFGGQSAGGESRTRVHDANERRAQIIAQTPFAAILGCSDSRVPVEIVFDQGLGDLFIVRVAGNVLDAAVLGSVEYAITQLKCHLIVVLGHEGCGAVKTAMLPQATTDRESEHVRYLADAIRPAVADVPPMLDGKARMREAVARHVHRQVAALRTNPVVSAAVTRGDVQVIGAFYEISSGAVDFFEQAQAGQP